LAKKNDCPCSIVISGGDAPRTGVTEAEDYRAEMLRLGVEDSDIVPEGRSLNTFQNAEFIEEIFARTTVRQTVSNKGTKSDMGLSPLTLNRDAIATGHKTTLVRRDGNSCARF
jgi:DUF218 domain